MEITQDVEAGHIHNSPSMCLYRRAALCESDREALDRFRNQHQHDSWEGIIKRFHGLTGGEVGARLSLGWSPPLPVEGRRLPARQPWPRLASTFPDRCVSSSPRHPSPPTTAPPLPS